MNLDQDKTEPARIFENLSDVYENGDAEDFTKFQADLLEKLNELSYVLKKLESGLLNRVNKLIEKTK
jgi:hypothetical protein